MSLDKLADALAALAASTCLVTLVVYFVLVAERKGIHFSDNEHWTFGIVVFSALVLLGCAAIIKYAP